MRSFRVNQLLGLLPKMDEDSEKTNSDDGHPNASERALLQSEHVKYLLYTSISQYFNFWELILFRYVYYIYSAAFGRSGN